jgi:hypothetical protein
VTRRLARVLVAVAGMAVASPAFAQATKSGPTKEFTAGVAWLGPVSFGSASADELRPDGSPLSLFQVENSLGSGFGARVGFGFQLTPALWAEFVGGYGWQPLKSKTKSDFEDADLELIESSSQQFRLEGAVLWYFRPTGKTNWFVRGGGGWQKELADGNALAEDAFIINGSLGLRRWWKQNPRTGNATGYRATFGADFRTGGLTLGESKLRVSPTATFSIVFGF